MNKDKNLRLKLFCSAFTLSAFTFGGGYVIVPLMRKRFVEENHWLEDEEMLDIVAISQSAPGIIAVNASILVGYKLAGISGAIITVFATVLPPLITITIIAAFYSAFRDNPAVSAVMKAMQAGVAAVVADAVFKMGKTSLKDNTMYSAIIMAACFAASYIFKINAALIILSCIAIGVVKVLTTPKNPDGGNAK